MPQRRLDREGVAIAWISPGHLHHRFTNSLLDTLDDGVWDGARIDLISGPRIAEARSQVFDAYLAMTKIPEWIWLVDTDMSFPGETLRRLMMAANRQTRPIVGGLCYAGGHSTLFPTIYETIEVGDGVPGPSLVTDRLRIKEMLDAQAPIKVAATGGACLLVHRDVVAKMKHPHPVGFGTYADGRPNPFPWFVEGQHVLGHAIGEDVAFTWRAHMMGFGVHVHTGIEIDHWKERPLNTALYHATPSGPGTGMKEQP